MKLTIIGSSSVGNSYIIQNDTTALLIEAGCSITKVKKALDFNVSKVAGCIVSHAHKDHAGKVNDVLKAGIDVYVSKETRETINSRWSKLPIIMKDKEAIMIGDFRVMPFYVVHDVPCFGFLIYHPECGKVIFLTDTYYCPFKFSELNQVMIEANYDIKILDRNVGSGKVVSFVRNRVIRSHMSIETTKETLVSSDLSQVKNIVLVHLSEANSDAENFKKQVEEVTGKKVSIANKNITIDFNINPF